MEYGIDMMIMAAVTNMIVEASYVFSTSNLSGTKLVNKNNPIWKQSLAFLSGTGLDIMIKEFNIAYDPDELREQFYNWFNVKH